MAIHDVDKSNSDRISPQPNSHDLQGVARMAAGTNSINPTTNPSSTVGRVQTKNNQILISDGSNVRIIIGYLPDGTYGFAVSKAGFNVSDGF